MLWERPNWCVGEEERTGGLQKGTLEPFGKGNKSMLLILTCGDILTFISTQWECLYHL